MSDFKPHILYVLPYLEQGGTEKQALSLIDYFRHEYHVSLLAPMGSTAYQFQALNIPHRQFLRWDFNFFVGINQFLQSLREIHKSHPIGLIHIHASHEMMAVIKLFFPQIPVVFTVHGYHGSSKQISYWLSSWMSNYFADRVITVCNAEQKILQALGLNPQKTTVIYNGVALCSPDPDRSQALAKQFDILPSQIILGTVARLTPDKGIMYLLQALFTLKQTWNNLHLIIAGTGEQLTELQQLVTDLKLETNVTFTGYIDRLADLINLFDIFVLPSLQEAFSLATLEAMSLKKPIVATTVGGFTEQICHGKTGLLVPPAQSDALVDVLSQLLTHPQQRKIMGIAGYDHYHHNFTEATMLNKTAEIYAEEIG